VNELARIEAGPLQGGRRTVRITGEIDLSNALVVRDRLTALADGARTVVVDLAALEYLDSQGIHVLVELWQRRREAGEALVVHAPAGTIAAEVLEVAGLADLLGTGRATA
jgi:anti-sigma B factor antagonist